VAPNCAFLEVVAFNVECRQSSFQMIFMFLVFELSQRQWSARWIFIENANFSS